MAVTITRAADLIVEPGSEERRSTEDQLAEQMGRLARRYEALEDFAALVAHELKRPIQLALLDPAASVELGRGLDLRIILRNLIAKCAGRRRSHGPYHGGAVANVLASVGR
jgi:signal transduction histidine kinase